MAGAILQEGNQRQLEVNEFHNQVGFLSKPTDDQVELFGSLRANPVMKGAGSIEATVKKTKIIVSEAVIREVLRLGDQPHHPMLSDQSRVQVALRMMSYEGGYPTYGRFAENVQGAPVAPAPPIIPVAPAPPPINAQIAEEHDVQLMQQVKQAADDEDEVLLVDSESEKDSSEETDSGSEIEIVMSDKEEDDVRQPVPMTYDNLAALLRSLQGGDGNPPSVSTTVVQETTVDVTADVTEESTKKKQKTDTDLTTLFLGLRLPLSPLLSLILNLIHQQLMHRRKQTLRIQTYMISTSTFEPPPRNQAVLVVHILLSMMKLHSVMQAKRDKSLRAIAIVMKKNMLKG
ncbi:hypothetical protein Hanom_Chr16g01463511 [Helianthus anomalus]